MIDLTGIKACLFDMDGTLIDSMGLWHGIDVEYFRKYGKVLPDTYQEEIEGLSVIETAVYTKEHYGFEDTIEGMIDEWNQMAHEQYAKHITFKPGVRDFLLSLKEKGIKMGVATSNSRFLFDAIADASGLCSIMDASVTGEEVSNGKPAPECYLKVASKLGVRPEECLVFEDIIMGLQAGINAGMKTVAVSDTYSASKWEEKKAMSDYYIESYEDVEVIF